MMREERERLARNLAEVIDDVYARALVPELLGSRQRERRVALVAKQVSRAMYIGWKNRDGSIDDEEEDRCFVEAD